MTTDNALDPPPARRRTGRVPFPRIAAVVAGVVVVAAAIFVVVHLIGPKPNDQREAMRAAFARGASSAQVQTPPAVTPEQAAQTQANLAALQRAADSPALAVHPTQVSTVSPLAGRAPSGTGVTPSSNSVGPADG
jgi:hypothetical protein